MSFICGTLKICYFWLILVAQFTQNWENIIYFSIAKIVYESELKGCSWRWQVERIL